MTSRRLADSLILLKDKKELVGAEVGVQYGEHAEMICKALNLKKLYLIDPYMARFVAQPQGAFGNQAHATVAWREAVNRLLNAGHPVQFIYKQAWELRGTGTKIIPDDFDFVYVDANHTYQGVILDLETYYPRIKKGGMLAGHDWKVGTGIEQAVHEFVDAQGIPRSEIKTEGRWEWWIIKKI